MSPFTWTPQKERAAFLFAENELTWAQIATEIGVTQRTIENWHVSEPFKARISEIAATLIKEVSTLSIASVYNRVKRRDLRWRQIRQVTEARADLLKDDPKAADAGTGIVVKSQRMIGSGESAVLVDVYEADVALLREEREIEKQAAIETGQWQEKSKVESTVEVIGLDDALERAYGKRPA